LRNEAIPEIANRLEAAGFEVFADWFAAGPIADDSWKAYEKARGKTYKEALNGYAAKHVFDFDLYHLNRSNAGVLVLPAGKSGHLELGYLMGQGKPGYILFDKEPDDFRWDVMYKFAKGVCFNVDELIEELKA
jgi:nucleoside 2-deoxyribosyltransferase